MTTFKNDKIKYFAIVLCVLIAVAVMTFPTGVMLSSSSHGEQIFGISRATIHSYTAYSFAMGQAQRFEPWIEDYSSDNQNQIRPSATNSLANFLHNADELSSQIMQSVDKHGEFRKMNFYLRI